MTHPTTAARDLYAAILRDPSCDLVRLAYADELDAAGECERANWIRQQIANPKRSVIVCYGDREVGQACPWDDGKKFCPGCSDMLDEGFPASLLGEDTVYWSRGFVDSVAMTMRQFMGGECERCGGTGELGSTGDYDQYIIECRNCQPPGLTYPVRGTGRTPGLASVICAKWPVTEIRLTGKEPRHLAGRWGWLFYGDYPEGTPGNVDMQSRLPVELMRNGLSVDIGKALSVIYFPTRGAAMLASSYAAVAYARELAGLPELKWRSDANNPLLDGPADRPVHAGNRPNDRLAGSTLSQ